MNSESERRVSEADVRYMRNALALARRGLGRVWPNPAVGCVVVSDERIVGRGWTQLGGRPHAETEALNRAGAAATGGTAYVSLEPCDHEGKTRPCTQALIAAGITRVVVAVQDPDPRVSGRGIERLRGAGIAVALGVCKDEAIELNAGFFARIKRKRPLFTLKVATTLDGRIATGKGESRWITGTRARAAAHYLRAVHDGVLIGSGTALADDPELTCRLPGMTDCSPVRIVADGRLRLALSSRLARTAASFPTWVLTVADMDPSGGHALTAQGITLIRVDPDAAGHPALEAISAELAARGLTRVLVEGGSYLAASFLSAGLVDRIAWFHANRVIGGDGLPAARAFGVDRLAAAPAFRRTSAYEIGDDLLQMCSSYH